MNDLVAVTLGNTSVAAATAGPDGGLRDVSRAPLVRLEALLAPRLEAADGPVVVCSVNPPALLRLRKTAQAAGCEPPRVAGEDFPIPIRTDVDEPDRVGTDRLLAALAAHRRAGGACIVVDAGTAVTVDAVDDAGTFLGGAIFPGPGLMARSLAAGTAQLPDVEIAIAAAAPVIGRSTEAAVRSGITRAVAAAVARLTHDMGEVLATAAPVYVTGGYAPPQDADGGAAWTVVPDLVLEGLVLAWREQREP